MIFLALDILISYFTSIPTYFFLINLILIPKNKLSKLIIITLVLDLLILNTYFFNTIILSIIFIFYKRLNITRVNFVNYLISLAIIYVIYIFIIGIPNYNILYLFQFILKNFIYNLVFYILCYKLLQKRIKLSR